MEKKIVVIAEHHLGKIVPATHEAISFALELNRLIGIEPVVIVLGKSVKTMAETLAKATGLYVVGIEGRQLDLYNAEQYKFALKDTLEDIDPEYICLTHTAMGLDLAPGLAGRLNASCITAIEGTNTKGDKVSFVRSIFGGKIQATIVPALKRTVITILPGAWKAQGIRPETIGHVYIKSAPPGVSTSRTFSVKESEEERLNLDDADVIVAAGRGIGTEENLRLVKTLPKFLTNQP